MKTAYAETYRVSKTFDAPLDFVYAWCTDFREDDPKMLGSKLTRHIHEKTRKRVIWTIDGKNVSTGANAVRVVWLKPPNAWRLETCGDKYEVGTYRLTAVGKDKTRLDMTFTQVERNKSNLQDKEIFVNETLDQWVNYVRFLEKDYKKSLRG
jgi:hypothetical protein